LETERLVIALDKVVPGVVLQNTLEGGLREFEVGGFLIKRKSEGSVFEVLADFTHVAHAVAEIGVMANELEKLRVVEIGEGCPQGSETRVL
jgi:hypothetical protein